MSKVGDSLKRKLGPLPVWGWAIIGGIALYWFRNRQSGGSGVGSSSASSADAAAQQQLLQAQALAAQTQTPQAPVVLGPGESVYDPNSGQYIGGSNGNNLSTSLLALIGALLSPQPHGHGHHHKRENHAPKPHHHHKRRQRSDTHTSASRHHNSQARPHHARKHTSGGKRK